MQITRRALFAATAALPVSAAVRAGEPDLSALRPITGDAVPIGKGERAARLTRAQALMKAAGIGAVLIEPGASLVYFTGVRWWRSERLTAAVIPVEGEPLIVTPFFEEPSVRESLGVPATVRVWQEHESPFAVIAGWLGEKKLLGRPIGIEETARFFAVDGLRGRLPGARIVSANPVVRACRMVKTPAEIALMQRAADVTMAAYRWTWPRIEAGMTPRDIGGLMSAATAKLGAEVAFNLVLLGEASAYPHGSGKPQKVEKDGIVLMDCGAVVHDYESDISRTFVHGTPNAEQRKVWDQVREGQQRAFAAAKIGVSAGSVDDAVRGWYASLGYGPDYKLPGLSHRTGHGIGMDGHEPVNLVRGEATKLAPGMCFSNEPGLYLPGKFGVRLEDCFQMTVSGPKWFSVPPVSLEEPIG
ncbi:Xaa-Pro peptidase family protein [Sphingomonas sp.]|uniref:M24 family metallopeptidase n=1 Tax=Sphingomonas sp. TaxID=28214 RepID=UPI001EB2C5AC|nr:Xaa-Pro peptidase family protein [Sphingomonas sp.]MBX3595168.1 aminopeptidase P family protein [Sphingomonas sp.]